MSTTWGSREVHTSSSTISGARSGSTRSVSPAAGSVWSQRLLKRVEATAWCPPIPSNSDSALTCRPGAATVDEKPWARCSTPPPPIQPPCSGASSSTRWPRTGTGAAGPAVARRGPERALQRAAVDRPTGDPGRTAAPRRARADSRACSRARFRRRPGSINSRRRAGRARADRRSPTRATAPRQKDRTALTR